MSISELYEQSGFPAKTAFRKIAAKKFTKEEIDAFIDGKSELQVFEKPTPNKNNHLRCSSYDFCISIDLMDLSKYAQQNGNFRWLLTAIDWRTRFGWAIPLKRKETSEVAPALVSIIESLPHYKDSFIRIISDKGKEFLGETSKRLDQVEAKIFRLWNIPSSAVTAGRKSSVLVERFNRTILTVLRRVFEHNKNFKWVDAIPGLIERYNKATHTTQLGKLVPLTLMENFRKSESLPPIEIDLDRRPQTFKPGDLVRVRQNATTFDKKTLTKYWSSEVYRVVSIKQDHATVKAFISSGSRSAANADATKQVLLSDLKPAKPVIANPITAPEVSNETMAKNVKTKRLQSRSNIKPGHEIQEITPTGEVIFKKRLQPSNPKRRTGKLQPIPR